MPFCAVCLVVLKLVLSCVSGGLDDRFVFLVKENEKCKEQEEKNMEENRIERKERSTKLRVGRAFEYSQAFLIRIQ